jgi:putative transposase
MNQVEVWFSILVRKYLKRSSFKSTDELKTGIFGFITYFNASMAKMFKWEFRGFKRGED